MAVIRFDPFRDPLERLLSMAATGTRAPLAMPMDVYRAGDGSYHVEADLPGVDPDSVEVTVEHSTLTIRAERTPHYGESDQVIVAERPQGSFTRQLSLGEGVDSENLTASYADGVLHVTIPASPKAQARRVEITLGPAAAAPSPGAQPGRMGTPRAVPALNFRPVRPRRRHGSRLVQAWGRQRTASWRQPDVARVVMLSPDGRTRLSRAPARLLPEPVPAHRQDQHRCSRPRRLGAAPTAAIFPERVPHRLAPALCCPGRRAEGSPPGWRSTRLGGRLTSSTALPKSLQ